MIDKKTFEEFLELTDYDSDFFNNFFETFKGYLHEIKRTSIDQSSLEDIAQMAHKAISSCGSLGALPLEKKLRELELAAKSEDLEEIAKIHTEVSELIEHSQKQILELSQSCFKKN